MYFPSILVFDMEKESKWQLIPSKNKHSYANQEAAPISIGSSVWFTDIRGMVEVDLNSVANTQITPYPDTFAEGKYGFREMISCKYDDDFIVIIDPTSGQRGIVFDTITCEYSDTFSFRNSSGNIFDFDINSSCVAVGDYVHIFHGGYCICSMIDQTSRKCNGLEQSLRFNKVAVIKTQSSSKMLISGFIRKQNRFQNGGDIHLQISAVIINIISRYSTFELFKFGGFDEHETVCTDSFYIGTLVKEEPSEPIHWELAPQYTLKYPMIDFGYVQSGPWIITFGGKFKREESSDEENASDNEESWKASNLEEWEFLCDHLDEIFVLDLRENSGWVESAIKCPEKSGYHAVLDDAQRVHLFARENKANKQYCIELEHLISL